MLDEIELNGRTYRVTLEADDTSDAPWDREDGHGEVSGWTTRDKLPGERILASGRNAKRYYDFAGAVAIAKRDGWDAKPYGTGTKGERAVRAVEADFKRLKDWCEDRWTYVGVLVTLLDAEGDATDIDASLWGIESDCEDYIAEIARELAEELDAPLLAASNAALEASRPDLYTPA